MLAILALCAPLPLDLSAAAKAEALKRVAALARDMEAGNTAFGAEEAADAIGKLGNPVAAQRVLAGRYPHAKEIEKCAILYVLNRIGVEGAVGAMSAIADDASVHRPKHPNNMSFATFYVLDRLMHHAWGRLPREDKEEKEAKEGEAKRGEDDPPPPPVPTSRVSKDGTVTTGTLEDRKELLRLVVAGGLHLRERRREGYPLPEAGEMDWVRTLAGHAFVRLRGRSSGVDLLFRKDAKGKWVLATTLGHWVN